jgi:hypothetical protein
MKHMSALCVCVGDVDRVETETNISAVVHRDKIYCKYYAKLE